MIVFNFKRIALIFAFAIYSTQLLAIPEHVNASPLTNERNQTDASFSRVTQIKFNKSGINQPGLMLKGIQPEQEIKFTVRRDQLVRKAELHLIYTPSPALITNMSQIKVYLNNELMTVIAIKNDGLGKPNTITIPLDPRYFSDINKLRFSFIGHYSEVCENTLSSSLWIDISQGTVLELTLQSLQLSNDLGEFPRPFFDSLDYKKVNIPFVFSQKPNLTQQKAAAILASWFGAKAGWRGQQFPVFFSQLPESHAVLFATNGQFPEFLKQHKPVNCSTVELISHPTRPDLKLLLVLGRNDDDLLLAAKGIAQGSILFRGNSLCIDKVASLEPRKPYDAPNWIATDRPVTFDKLEEYQGQFESSGLTLYPFTLYFNVPPDLFLYENKGAKLSLDYRYSPPISNRNSHLDLSLNHDYVGSISLDLPEDGSKIGTVLSRSSPMQVHHEEMIIPTSQFNALNSLSFDFQYSVSVGISGSSNHCTQSTQTINHAVIFDSSTLDFSQYYHYLLMPNLSAFVKGGFPFTRMADLSDTAVLVNQSSSPQQVSTLLNVMGLIGAKTGYPVLAVTLSSSWEDVKAYSKDLLILGGLPPGLLKEAHMNFFMQQSVSWIDKPLRSANALNVVRDKTDSSPDARVVVIGDDSVAAIVGLESPMYKGKSILALVADKPHQFELLSTALTNPKKYSAIYGSIAVIKDKQISSVSVGPVFAVGYLPWFIRCSILWNKSPLTLACTLLLVLVLLATLIRFFLANRAKKRLKIND